MPLPVFARSVDELRILHNQEPVRHSLALCARADATFVGIGQIDQTAPLVVDGFLTAQEVRALRAADAVGEITSWVYDSHGRGLSGGVNELVASAPLAPAGDAPVIGVAVGAAKVPAFVGALRSRLINAVITDEATATEILDRG